MIQSAAKSKGSFGRYKSETDLAEGGRCHDMPRLKADAIEGNAKRMGPLSEIAKAKACSQAAVALAWLLAQGEDVVALPGCSRRASLKDCLTALDVKLTADEVAALSCRSST